MQKTNEGQAPIAAAMPKKLQKVYISGKVSDLPTDEVAKKFYDAETNLRLEGYRLITNPVAFVREYNRTQLFIKQPTLDTWEQIMVKLLARVLECNILVALPDWVDSKGSQLEMQLAVSLKKEIIKL